jgi:triose/dihydroxyacetone kinase / FAD-AMP lyase (cyclizing)
MTEYGSIFFSALGQGLAVAAKASPDGVTSKVWISALEHALETFYSYTRARPPSRTLVDPLSAFVTSLSAADDLSRAVELAKAATDRTAEIEAKAGRSAYVENKKLRGIPDPGAVGVNLIIQAIAS